MILSAGGLGGGRALVLGVAPHWKIGTAVDPESVALDDSEAERSLLLTKSTSTWYLPCGSVTVLVFESLPPNESLDVPLTSSCPAAVVPLVMPRVKMYDPEVGTSMKYRYATAKLGLPQPDTSDNPDALPPMASLEPASEGSCPWPLYSPAAGSASE